MSFKINDLRFIDSYKFMKESLEKPTENLYSNTDDKYEKLKCMKTIFGNKVDLLCRKGYYPYEWVDAIDKFSHEGLPPANAFHTQFSQKGISEDGYAHALKVYEKMNCKTFKDYHMTYLRTDVVLLADIFENFRDLCMSYLTLDPANYITAASLAWDAQLLKTGIELEQNSDIKIPDIIERQKRGGLCFVGSKIHVKAYNRY